MRCDSCSGVWLDDPPAVGDLWFHYDEHYHRAITAAGEENPSTRWRRHKEVVLQHKREGSILDLGCSSGSFLGMFKDGPWQLYGIEIEPSTAERARQNSGAHVFVGELLDAPFAAESFDVVTCFDVLEHLYHPRQVVAKVMEWLKPGGLFFVVLPNVESWEAQIFGSYWYGLELPRHFTHFSPQALRNLMAAEHFEEVSLATRSTAYVEYSLSYVCSKLLELVGITPTPISEARDSSLLWRAIRKLLHLAVAAPFGHLASAARSGASLQAVFRKGACPDHIGGNGGLAARMNGD
jgi:2-polyprenyl-3-methyl-5-hydroxy-6-metoxy-1,4-benzoquinol methylase